MLIPHAGNLRVEELDTRLDTLEVAMPRRTPGEVRAGQPRRLKHHAPTVIRGLSASANRQIADFERANGLRQGEVASAFQRWAQTAHRANRRSPLGDGYHNMIATDDPLRSPSPHIRLTLEHALHILRRRARRELHALINPLDDRYIARTVNNPHAPIDLPWWYRRIEI
ncbi:hypothetical protein GCM10009839_69580 [Catenulispora yoronensis]|uniref:Uncharacterized protein n=1 Tax=Catenulispora yoronensis TaxID=450799 RepID=A0ABP5GNI4_9ACTN